MVILDSIIEGAAHFPKRQRERFLTAVIDYQLTGEVPDLSGVLLGAFLMVRPAIDNSMTRQVNGRRGGRGNRIDADADKANEDQAADSEKANGKLNAENEKAKPDSSAENAKANGKLNAKNRKANGKLNAENEKAKRAKRESEQEQEQEEEKISLAGDPKEPAPAFADPGSAQPPTLDDVRVYFAANCLMGDPEDYYLNRQKVGWIDPQKRPIIDWHADAQGWSKREPKFRQYEADRRAASSRADGEAPMGERWTAPKSDEQKLAELKAKRAAREGTRCTPI